MNRRVVVMVSLVVVLGNTAAAAAPARSCKLLGRSRMATVNEPNEALEILSADIASNARNVTMVIRMATLDDPQAAATGRTFWFHFSRGIEESYVVVGTLWSTSPLRMHVGRASQPFDPRPGAHVVDVAYFADVPAVVDTAKREVRVTVPVATFAKGPGTSSLKNGRPVSYLGAEVARTYGYDRGLAPTDTPVPSELGLGGRWTYGGRDVTYVLGSPSCVAVGR